MPADNFTQKFIFHITYGINFQPKIAKLKNSIEVQKARTQDITLKISGIEAGVFARFCEEVGISNIQEYENCQVIAQEERKEKCLEYEKQIDHIYNNLKFEESRDTLSMCIISYF